MRTSVLLPILVGLSARLLFIAWTSPLRELQLDEARFWDLATTRMEGTAFLPPLYPFFLAALRLLFGDALLAVRIAGACLSVLSIVLVHRLAERLHGPGAGLRPALAAALLPTLVYYDGRIRSESLAALLLLGLAWFWTAPPAGRRAWRTLLAGVLLGLLALLKPQLVLIGPALVAIGFRRDGAAAALRRGALLLPGLVLLILPWSLRNERVLGRFAVVSTNGGYNFWKSFNPWTDGSQVPAMDDSIWSRVSERDLDVVGYPAGWRFIREHPARSLLLVPMKLAYLCGPELDFLADVRHLRHPRRSLAIDLSLGLLMSLTWLLLLAAGLYALLGDRRHPVKDVVVAVLLVHGVVHAVFFGDPRFHAPLLPFLCLALPEAADGRPRPRPALRLLGGSLAALLAAWILIASRQADRIGDLLG